MSAQPEPYQPSEPNPLLRAALRYGARGIPVFPLQPRGKLPLTAHGFKDASANEFVLRAWWREWPQANIGIPTGMRGSPSIHGSGWIVVDVDTRHGGSLEDLARRIGTALPDTRMAVTGSGGWHLLFHSPGSHLRGTKPWKRWNAEKSREEPDPAYEIKADGGYFVASPSVHPNGNRYRWLNTLPIAPAPAWLLELLRREPAPKTSRTSAPAQSPRAGTDTDGEHWLAWALERTGDGNGDVVGFECAQQLLIARVPDPEAFLLRYAAAATVNSSDPFTERDVARWLSSASRSDLVRRGEPARSKRSKSPSPNISTFRAHRPVDFSQDDGHFSSNGVKAPEKPSDVSDSGPDFSPDGPPPRTYPWTEMGNAERLLDQYGQRFRYCAAFGFCTWDGQRWRADDTLAVRRWAKETIRRMYDEAASLATRASQCEDENTRKLLSEHAEHLQAWARKSESDRMVAAMLKLAADFSEVIPDVFDADPWLLNCANGILDLRTGKLSPHRRDAYLMQLAPVAYDSAATCPRFERFVEEIMLGRVPLVTYLQRTLGYAITGDVSEQIWHLMIGEGENGKGTLMEVLGDILGDYAGILEPESLIVSAIPHNGSAPSPDIADLKGKRFVRVTETEEGARLAPARIKKFSGGDTVKARRLHQKPFDFRPTCKIFLYTNHRPQARETTHAFWRRVRMVPFEMNLREHPERKDGHLIETLRGEASGILNWLLAGCLAWQRDGLRPPAEVIEATESYRDEQDLLKQFLSECCFVDPTARARATPLYEAYTAWCKESGVHAQPRPRLTATLRERGYARVHTRSGDVWEGIGVLDGSYRMSAPHEPDEDV